MSTSRWFIPLALFVVFASPMTFKAVRGVAGGWVASAEGQAKFLGLLLHAVIFTFAVRFLMKRVSFFVPTTQSRSNQIDKMMELSGDGLAVTSGPDMGPSPTRPNLMMGSVI